MSVLSGEKWIAGCPRCRGHLLELCARAGFEPHIAFETDNFVAVEGLVAQGIGVATLPRMAVASFPQLPGVVTLPLPPERGADDPRRHRARRRPGAGDPRDPRRDRRSSILSPAPGSPVATAERSRSCDGERVAGPEPASRT